ncbi:MAG TPA: TonB-dependent receptor [Usitatibacter sp.]|nr:TonB-dependent receptor [Usitatibacter sp.]
MKKLPIVAHSLATALAAASTIALAQEPARIANLADFSLEELANLKVTTVSRREEPLVEAPASVFVITAEDIRRSGATSLLQALRLAPNLMAIRVDQNQFVASARGGLSGLADKMLVLVDGRTVYSPLFSGVFWDAQGLVLEDIDRIEVISGPGSTLWGTNAVNGVINIITKPATQTQGLLAAAYGGDKESGAAVRAGAPLAGGAYRIYGKYARREPLETSTGASTLDSSDNARAGFRADWGRGSTRGTLQGDIYTANVGTLGGHRDLQGGNVLGRWHRTLDSGSELMLQAYYDRARRVHVGSLDEVRDTYDVELVHTLRALGAHELNWGAEYRSARDRTRDTPALAFVPRDRILDSASLFAQDEIALARRVRATVGVRAERNPYSGLEWLPDLRVSWNVAPEHLVWAALTRTVRSPSRIDRDLVVPGAPPYLLVNNETFESERANVAQLGYRARIAPGATVSLTAFHHEFRDLRTLGPGEGALVIANGANGRISGVEGWGDWRVRDDWRLVGGFTLLRTRTSLEPGQVNLTDPPLGDNPRKTALLRSLWNITGDHELDLAWRYQGPLSDPHVGGYAIVDARLGWRLSPRLELSFVVRNAFDRGHVEFAGDVAKLGRTWLVKATWMP